MNGNPEILNVLAEYQAHGNRRDKASDAVDAARKQIDKLCAPEKRQLSRRARKIFEDGREGWSILDSNVHVIVNHSTRPYKYSLVAYVRLLFSEDCRRGELRLSSLWAEREKMLAELAAMVGAK